jgi:hypothetical protein
MYKDGYIDWKTQLMKLYGEIHGPVNLFINHVYFLLVIQEIVLEYLRHEKIKAEITNEVQLIQSLLLEKNPEFNFIQWIFDESNIHWFKKIKRNINKLLVPIVWSQLTGDVFSELYHNLVHNFRPSKSSEYYTPNWLCKYLINKAQELHPPSKGKIARVLDPTCGSGSFLANWITSQVNYQFSLEDIINNIHGMDVNPIAVYMARASYLFSLPNQWRNINMLSTLPNPIIIQDSLFTDADSIIEKYDILIGNPPWGAMRFISGDQYRDYLKQETFKYNILLPGEIHLFSQLELSALFFCKSVDHYLQKFGTILFVMPKSVIVGTKHLRNFRKFQTPTVKIIKIFDLQGVHPLFGNPACVLVGLKGEKTEYPVLMEQVSGIFSDKAFITGELDLKTTSSEYISPEERIKSFYYHKFKTGASIFPRSLYFVDIQLLPDCGDTVLVSSSKDVISRSPWSNFDFSGEIPVEYLFTTLLAWEMLPFGYQKLRNIALPFHIDQDKTIHHVDPSKEKLEWFKKVDHFWISHGTPKSKIQFPSLNDRLNYNGLFHNQDLKKQYLLLYSGTGKNICACVIDRIQIKEDQNIFGNEFIADVKTWKFETDNLHEAHYLCMVLNSKYLNKQIKPLQPHGLGGPRAVHRLPLEFPIPHFDSNNQIHRRLANISIEAHQQVEKFQFRTRQNLRKQVRERLNDQIDDAEQLTIRLLNNPH